MQMLAKKQLYNRKNKLTFSRWSRKSWAVFCSIGNEVKIAVLKLVVANGFIKKNTEGIYLVEENKNFISDEHSPDETKVELQNPLLALFTLSQPQKNVVCGGQSLFNFLKYFLINKLHPFLSGKDFLFFMPEKLIIKKSINEVVMLRFSKHDISIMSHTSRATV